MMENEGLVLRHHKDKAEQTAVRGIYDIAYIMKLLLYDYLFVDLIL
jgi:hypothetical protein